MNSIHIFAFNLFLFSSLSVTILHFLLLSLSFVPLSSLPYYSIFFFNLLPFLILLHSKNKILIFFSFLFFVSLLHSFTRFFVVSFPVLLFSNCFSFPFSKFFFPNFHLLSSHAFLFCIPFSISISFHNILLTLFFPFFCLAVFYFL